MLARGNLQKLCRAFGKRNQAECPFWESTRLKVSPASRGAGESWCNSSAWLCRATGVTQSKGVCSPPAARDRPAYAFPYLGGHQEARACGQLCWMECASPGCGFGCLPVLLPGRNVGCERQPKQARVAPSPCCHFLAVSQLCGDTQGLRGCFPPRGRRGQGLHSFITFCICACPGLLEMASLT